MNASNLKSVFFKVEPLLFLFAVLINLYPIFSANYFPFVDAPSHLYNAKLIQELLGGNTFIHEYIKFNPVFVPNSISYIITTPLLCVFSPQIAEKIFLMCYFIGLPFAFRYCVGAINKQQKHISFLIIPFIYNFLSVTGFYNFSLGIVLMFLTIGFFYKSIIVKNTKWHHYLILFALLILTYSCHLVVFGLMMICLLFIYTWFLINTFNYSILKWLNKKTYLLVLLSIPVLCLSAIYFKTVHTLNAEFVYLSNKELFGYVKDGRCFTVFNASKEEFQSGLLASLYMISFFVCVFLFFKTISKSVFKNRQLYFLLPVLFSVGLYILSPDSDGHAGFVSVRICLLTFLLSVLSLSVFTISNKFIIPLCVLALAVNFSRLPNYKKTVIENYNVVKKIIEQEKLIEPNSFIAFKKHNDNWLSDHYSNYLGINKPVICLENYECASGYSSEEGDNFKSSSGQFPLTWQDGNLMWQLHQNILEFKNLDVIKKQLHNKPIYYFILGDLKAKTDSVSVKFKQNLIANCTLINTTEVSSLYKLK